MGYLTPTSYDTQGFLFEDDSAHTNDLRQM